jgi:hypothetical protein
MPLFGNSSGYGELIFILIIIVFQLIGVIFKKLNEKKEPSPTPPRREFKPSSQPSPPARHTPTPPSQEPPKIEEELKELFEALGMDSPLAEEKPSHDAWAPPSPPTPTPSVQEQNVPKTVSFEQKKQIPTKISAPPPTPVLSSKNQRVEETIEFKVAPLLKRSLDPIDRNIDISTSSYADLKTLLKDPNKARRGIVIAEILGKPVGLR